jgi:hypothetical protein
LLWLHCYIEIFFQESLRIPCVERTAAIIAKLVEILAKIDPVNKETHDSIEWHKLKHRALQNAAMVHEPANRIEQYRQINEEIKTCLDLLLYHDILRVTSTPEASAFFPLASDLSASFPGYSMADHQKDLATRVADATVTLDCLERGKVVQARREQPGTKSMQPGSTVQSRSLTLWDFVVDDGEVAQRLSQERIERARQQLAKAKEACSNAAATYHATFLTKLPGILAGPVTLIDATSTKKQITSLLDMVLAIASDLRVSRDVSDEITRLATLVGVVIEPSRPRVTEIGELEAVQAAIADLKARIDGIEQDRAEPSIDPEDRRVLAGKRGRLESTLHDLQHTKMDLDVRVARKVAEQERAHDTASLKLVLACIRKMN